MFFGHGLKMKEIQGKTEQEKIYCLRNKLIRIAEKYTNQKQIDISYCSEIRINYKNIVKLMLIR